ncbi:hypothetical protein RvY_00942 [Ramazzottius varieornatus]|uniref:Uncharacterized protein n=1 Tax=Ramazzottius varieornatus TaxID=947166 RepID=A0A1D1UEJ7_RAMVA|nr:hypothetical protein RvY_00942 [Ramazzottius varieornatus]
MYRLVVYTWLCVVFVGAVVGAPFERQVRQSAAGANEATAIVTTIDDDKSHHQTSADSTDSPAMKVREAEHDPDHPQADQPGASSESAQQKTDATHAADSPAMKVREAEDNPDHPQADQPDKPSEVVAKLSQDPHHMGSSGDAQKTNTHPGNANKAEQTGGPGGSSVHAPGATQDTKHSTDLTASSSAGLSSQTIAGSPVGVKTKRDVANHSGPVGSSSAVGGNTHHGSADATHEHNKDPDSKLSAQENFFKSGDVSKSSSNFPPREG